MNDHIVDKIKQNSQYLALRKKRNRLAYILTSMLLLVYFGYISLIAFNKPFLAQPIGSGVTTVGIPLGMAVIVFTIIITGIYVRRANSEFDAMTKQILKEATQ
ncbi:DUF485 domain-containing protein [Acinetobacter sp. YK3]|uniref:DUF485 domain-containing protein n=1 Tax=Acinetobacter sp. YK3 TaxID=1860097 RepID=UPI00084BCB28|nr:DUF485 domain-containing protein [Acinetobacter sp. YK3]OEC86427.1 hypothetical protein A9Z07_01385 [Acinetobacter sp. YK3]